jgi:DNA-binding NarL/FixJ family response regulator
VLRLLARGLRNAEIARHLTVSENTVKAHIKRIYRKLMVHDRVQAIRRARELGLIKP